VSKHFLPSLASAFAFRVFLSSQWAAGASQPATSRESLTAAIQPGPGLLECRFQGRQLFAYNFASNQFKPYVRELFTLRGDNVLRDAPADHLHHHGLMYAIGVNGVNFWEEANQPGHQRHVTWLAQDTRRSPGGLPRASFTELIHWVAHDDRAEADTTHAALLVERRTLTLTVDEAKEEVALAWHAEFEVGPRTNRVTLHGSDYNGLGLRLPAAWDHVARHENSEQAPYPAGGKPGAVPARWCAVSRTTDGRAVQVALFARPRGHAGTNCFFAMTEPFTYLAATQGLDRAPLEYRVGDRFAIDYLLLAYAAARTSAQLEARYLAWARELQ
jgi:hypothetical protein